MKCLGERFGRGSFWEERREQGAPPPPTLFESRDWRGVRKSALQSLEPLRVGGQSLDNKGVMSLAGLRACRFRLDDDVLFEFLRQGWMSQRAEEKARILLDRQRTIGFVQGLRSSN